MSQEQSHGFNWENDIRINVFGLNSDSNNTDKHDINASDNKYGDENISIKVTGTKTICMGDLLRTFIKDDNMMHTMIVVKYRQVGNKKTIERIYEYDLVKAHDYLFGKDWTNDEKEVMKNYINKVKSIPKSLSRDEIKKYYNYSNGEDIMQLRNIIKGKKGLITINPKVDTKGQRRVQCSISNFIKNLERFKIYASPHANVNCIRGCNIISEIESPPRCMTQLYTKKSLLKICSENKDKVSKYSHKSKYELIKLLSDKSIITQNNV